MQLLALYQAIIIQQASTTKEELNTVKETSNTTITTN